MALIDLPTAKLHLRVTDSAEDALVTVWTAAAEQQVAEFLGRNVYADPAALAVAKAAAPAGLAAATVAYDAAIAAAWLIADEEQALAARDYAADTYQAARAVSDRTQAGIVVNETIKAAVLLTLANLYEHRGETAEGLTRAARSLLQPYRAGMGV